MAYYLGLGAGGTKTECAIAHDRVILARATSGTIKIMRASTEEAGQNLDSLLQAAATQSGISLNSIACTCVGLAGISVPRIAEWARHALRARVSGEILFSGDEEIALDAAFFGCPGVLVIAGTGSNIIVRSSEGKLIRVGGWGPTLADEGSGNWIGKQAVRAVFDALDHDEPTLLLKNIMETWNLPGLSSLIDLANQSPSPDFSNLTPVVVNCAQQGDSYAQRVLRQAGEHLGTFAALALHRLQSVEHAKLDRANVELPQIAFTGSILRRITSAREAMCATLRREVPGASIRTTAVDPVEGALWRARHSRH